MIRDGAGPGAFLVLGDVFGEWIQFVQSTFGAKPDISFFIFSDRMHDHIGNAVFTKRIVVLKTTAIIPAQTMIGGEPHKSPAILENKIDPIVGEALFSGDLIEDEIVADALWCSAQASESQWKEKKGCMEKGFHGKKIGILLHELERIARIARIALH